MDIYGRPFMVGSTLRDVERYSCYILDIICFSLYFYDHGLDCVTAIAILCYYYEDYMFCLRYGHIRNSAWDYQNAY